MSAGTVVVVEDDLNIADLLEMYLRQDGFRVVRAADGGTALEVIGREEPRLVLLDISLPGELDGLAVCRALRSARKTASLPVIVVTARGTELDRVLGLELGADDYVTKPFSPREVVARVKAVLRRADGPGREEPEVLLAGGVEVDTGRREARVGAVPVPLAAREMDLLTYLASNQGLALSRQQLLDGVWGPGWVGDPRTVDVHVRQLRKKLGDALPLATVWGVGYRLG